MFSAAIFDMDGLLLDSERAIMRAWITAAGAHGLQLLEADYLYVVGRGASESDARLTELLGGSEAFAQVRDCADALLLAASGTVFPMKPGALALLMQLRERSVPCAIASSTEVAEVRRRLHAIDALHFFAAVAGGDEVPRGKPDPAVYLLAAKRLGVSPTACLAFEDSDNGVLAARAAGLSVIVVPDLKTPDASLSLLQLPSLEAARDYLDAWF